MILIEENPVSEIYDRRGSEKISGTERMAKGTEKTVISKRLKVSKTTLYRYLVYTGLHLPINCHQEGWEEYGIYH